MGFLSNLFGGGPKTTVVQSKIPEELAPYVTEVNKEQQELYRRRLAEEPSTYQYQGQTIADLTQDQLDARAGIRGLVGSTEDDFALARQGITGGDERFTTDISPERIDALQRGDYDRIDPTVAARGVDFTGAPTGFTSERFQEKDISEYMNPYQRAVTDIEKRKAQEDFAKLMPQFEKQAISMGGMSGYGSRAGVQAGLLGAKQLERLGDLEKTGLLEAYKDAQTRKAEDFDRFRDQRSFEERERAFLEGERDYLTGLDIGNIDRRRGERAFDVGFDRNQQAFLKGERDFEKGERTFEAQQFADRKKRERQQAQDLQSLAKGRYGQEMRELGALETLGADAEKRAQKGLDRSYADWLERRERPETLLGRYTSAIYGNPMLAKPSQTTTTPGVPFGQQLLGIGTAIAGAGGFNPFFGAKAPGATGGGIASLMPTVYKDNGGMIQENIDRYPKINVGDISIGFDPNIDEFSDVTGDVDEGITYAVDQNISNQQKALERLRKAEATGDAQAGKAAKEALLQLQKSLKKRSDIVEQKGAAKVDKSIPSLRGLQPTDRFAVDSSRYPEWSQSEEKLRESGKDASRKETTKTFKGVTGKRYPVSGYQKEKLAEIKGLRGKIGDATANTALNKILGDYNQSSGIGMSKEKSAILKNLMTSMEKLPGALDAYSKTLSSDEIKKRYAETEKNRTKMHSNYIEKMKNLSDERLQSLKKAAPPKADINQLLVMIGLKGAVHKDGFLAGAGEAYMDWKKQNDLNEKEARLLDKEIATLKYDLEKTQIGAQYDFSKLMLSLDEKSQEEIRKLPADKLAIIMKEIAAGKASADVLKVMNDITGGKIKQIGKGTDVDKIAKRLWKTKNIRIALGGKNMGTASSKLDQLTDESAVVVSQAISRLAAKMIQANPRVKKDIGGGHRTDLEGKLMSDLSAYAQQNGVAQARSLMRELITRSGLIVPPSLR
tara:strand:+ start:2731 stop:5583 length:2853 start_codon:yes stop_codon:yes gene_type:complete